MIDPTEYAMREIGKHLNCSIGASMSRQDKVREILVDHYSNVIYDMTDEELAEEYVERIGGTELPGEGL